MLWSITCSQIEYKMNKLKQKLAYKFPNLRNVLILLKLYCKHPQKLVLDLKILLRKKRGKKLGITFIKPNNYIYIFFDRFDDSSSIIDVGCGYEAELSVYLISRYGLRAFGVDPTIKHRKLLHNLEQQLQGKFKHIRFAVTSSEGEIIFHETEDNESGSVLMDHKNIISDRIKSYKVETTTISGLLNYLGLQTVDFLKLDLEGAEYDLLCDVSENDLNAFKQIYVEFHHHAIKRYSSKDTNMIVSSICKKGFNSFSLDDHNYLFYRNCFDGK